MRYHGFCAYHDRELFKEIDMKFIEPTIEQSVLLSIRSIAFNIYAKDVTSKMDNIIKEVEHGSAPVKQTKIEEIMQLHQESSKIGLIDLREHYINFFGIYTHKEFSRVNRLIIKIVEQPEVMCSTCFNPEYDLHGNLLQRLIEVEDLDILSFEVFSNGEHGIIQFCWYDNFPTCKKFVESIIQNEDIPNTILKLIFARTENHAFKISWFNNLSVLKKKGLMKLMMNSLESTDLDADVKSINSDRKKYVNWHIKNIEKLY